MPTFDLQPTLIGPRVIVRPVTPSDRQEMFAAASDPKIWTLHPAPDRYLEPAFGEYFDGALASGSAFAFVDRGNGAIIGSSRYYGLDLTASEIEIGWTFLTRAHWGGGCNSEIKQLMLKHAFKYVDTVIFWVGKENLRSQRAMQKIGGVLRDGIHSRSIGGGRHGHVVYEIRKDLF